MDLSEKAYLRCPKHPLVAGALRQRPFYLSLIIVFMTFSQTRGTGVVRVYRKPVYPDRHVEANPRRHVH